MKGFSIRPAQLTDADLIASLSRSTFIETFARHNSRENMNQFMNGPFAHAKLAEELKTVTNYFFLALVDDAPAGYLKLREGVDHPAMEGLPSIEIARIYVKSAFAGKGLGTALMHKALEVAGAKGKKRIWLGVWEKNEKAIGFYRSLGYQKFGSHIFMLGADPQTDWLMMREV